MPLRVMSYNIKGSRTLSARTHVDELAAVIRDAAPDVAGLQEVHRGTRHVRRRDQPAELQRATAMNAFFGESFEGYGNLLLTRGTIVDARVERLPGKGEPRTLLAATIDIDGLRFIAYVTHLVAWRRLGARTRLMQATAVAEIVASSPLPFVLMGDFNSTPGESELSVFQDGKLVTSCFAADVITHRATKSCLDYVFADPRWTIRDARVLRVGPSDHWPLVTDLDPT
jgi:endonuclease/exonuclease/phosphatase family metal-dependent hydrolase